MAKRSIPTPNGCLEHRPNPKSVLFSGYFINLSTIAMRAGLSTSTVSMIFRGNRQPSLRAAKLISTALGMTLNGFVEALEDHTSHAKYKILKKVG